MQLGKKYQDMKKTLNNTMLSPEDLISFGSDYGLVPDGTKPLPGPMSTGRQ